MSEGVKGAVRKYLLGGGGGVFQGGGYEKKS